jgi:hypothetical protein
VIRTNRGAHILFIGQILDDCSGQIETSSFVDFHVITCHQKKKPNFIGCQVNIKKENQSQKNA